MKKKFFALLSIFTMVISVSAMGMNNDTVINTNDYDVFDTDNYIVVPKTEDTWSVIADNLDPETYGGIYVDNGQLHISVTDEAEVTQLIEENTGKEREKRDDIVIEKAKYSYKDLSEAADILWEAREDFGIEGIRIINKTNNIILVTSELLTEQQKEMAKKMTNVDNIEFEKLESKLVDHSITLKCGSEMNRSGVAPYALGCALKPFSGGSNIKFLTSGHGVTDLDGKKDTFYLGSSDRGELIGKASDVRVGEKLDCCLISRDNTNCVPTSRLISGGDHSQWDTWGSPIEGEDIELYGAQSNVRTGKILDTNTKYKGDNRINFEDNFGSSYYAQQGDSGSPLVVYRNGQAVLVGIHKGNWTGISMGIKINNITTAYGLMPAKSLYN